MNCGGEIVEMFFHWRGHGVEPVDRADEIVQGLAWGNVFDAEGENGQAAADGAFDFFGDVAGSVGVGGENQDHHCGDVDGFDDGFAVRAAGDDVAWSDPAADAGGFEAGTDGVSDDFIF